MEEEARRILDGLKIDLDPRQVVGELPVSKQQMVEIAKALSTNARVLIMDEPTSALTAREIDDLFRIIRDLKEKGCGIVYISHRLEELQHIVDRVTIMRDGQYITRMDFQDTNLDEIIAYMVGLILYGQAGIQRLVIGIIVVVAVFLDVVIRNGAHRKKTVKQSAATDSCVMREEGFRSAFEGSGFELLETQYGEGDAAKSQSIAENYIAQGVAGIFGCNEGSTTGAGNAIKATGKADIIGVGFDKSDAILGLIDDGFLLATMAQNPDVMGSSGVEACVKALEGTSLGGAVTDTGVSVLTK